MQNIPTTYLKQKLKPELKLKEIRMHCTILKKIPNFFFFFRNYAHLK